MDSYGRLLPDFLLIQRATWFDSGYMRLLVLFLTFSTCTWFLRCSHMEIWILFLQAACFSPGIWHPCSVPASPEEYRRLDLSGRAVSVFFLLGLTADTYHASVPAASHCEWRLLHLISSAPLSHATFKSRLEHTTATLHHKRAAHGWRSTGPTPTRTQDHKTPQMTFLMKKRAQMMEKWRQIMTLFCHFLTSFFSSFSPAAPHA